MLTAASWVRPFGHHLWKRKTFLLAILIIVLFVLLFTQYSELNANSPGRPSLLDGTNKYLSFQQNANSDFNVGANQAGAVLPRPMSLNKEYKNAHFRNNNINNHYNLDEPIVLPSGQPEDAETRQRRDKIKEMMNFAWSNYVKYAWGENELKPISKRAHVHSVFGKGKLGATIIDSMDTLYIMGFHDEFNRAKEWIKNEFDLANFSGEISVFETTIRVVGGLLTCYAFTRDRMFVDKAKQVADLLLPAFDSKTGIPYSLINVRTKVAKNYQWASSNGYSILSEIGTLHLEFIYLSELTGDPKYKDKVLAIRDILNDAKKPKENMYPNYINPKTAEWGQHHYSMGALGDSFYEYLLKAAIQSGGEDKLARQMFDNAIAAITKDLLKTSKGGLQYYAERKFDRIEHKMDHLACFSGGLLVLGADTGNNLSSELRQKYKDIAAALTNTCHESYIRTETRLGPECFRFTEDVEAKATRLGEKYYILRPETLESYYYLWKFTKDPKYRDWAWDAVQALEKHCRVEAGYTGLRDVYDENSQKDDVQQSFFTAEALKYLYLIFSNDDLMPLDEWVFNTEAHPLPIKGKNPLYNVIYANSSVTKEEDSKQIAVPNSDQEADKGRL